MRTGERLTALAKPSEELPKRAQGQESGGKGVTMGFTAHENRTEQPQAKRLLVYQLLRPGSSTLLGSFHSAQAPGTKAATNPKVAAGKLANTRLQTRAHAGQPPEQRGREERLGDPPAQSPTPARYPWLFPQP